MIDTTPGHTLTLSDGLTIGEETHKVAVLRMPSAAQIMSAAREAEVVVFDQSGRPALATSPALLSFGMLAYQVASIGDYQGPFTPMVFGRLTGRDLDALQVAVGLLGQAEGTDLDRLVQGALTRGRSDGAS